MLICTVQAVCTVTLNKNTYFPQSVATATMICTDVNEKSQTYTLTWKNSSTTLQTNTGTTPATVSQPFFQSLSIPSGSYYLNANATLTGTNLEGYAIFNVTGANITSLIITNPKYSDNTTIYVGKTIGVMSTILDENNYSISGATCNIAIEDGNGYPILTSEEKKSYYGEVNSYFQLQPDSFEEYRQYIFKVNCYCGAAGTDNSCLDVLGNEVNLSVGKTQFPFRINQWLNVTTTTDKISYYTKDRIFICANVTNSHPTKRIPIEIYYRGRCSSGVQTDNDTDRSLIISNDAPELRGVYANSTQMFCMRFIVPEAKFIQGQDAQCSASTTVWVMNEENTPIIAYNPLGSTFYINKSDMNVEADWERVGNYTFNSIINLSSNQYSEYNGTGISN